jgi:hypothetical protein
MFSPALAGVFANAALPQKVVLVALVAAIPMILIMVVVALRGGPGATVARRTISDMRVAAPIIALLTGGLNSFHMGETIVRVPVDATLKQLAPGIFEVSALVSLGALVGIVALVAHATIRLTTSQHQAC